MKVYQEGTQLNLRLNSTTKRKLPIIQNYCELKHKFNSGMNVSQAGTLWCTVYMHHIEYFYEFKYVLPYLT